MDEQQERVRDVRAGVGRWVMLCGGVLGLLWLGACASVGSYVWVDELPKATVKPEGNPISVGDSVNVQVFGQDPYSAKTRVRPDGRISMPYVGDVEVAGRNADEVSRDVENRLKKFMHTPTVTVVVDETANLRVPVIGEVTKPGTVQLERGASVMAAIAGAGGLTDFASRDRIFVVRRFPFVARIRFTYQALTQAEGKAATFMLQPGDSVVVE